jgi:sirohydrochlorin cobaltochelatase
MSTKVIVLIGHGGTARDTPRELVSELKALEGRRMAAGGGPMSPREAELDAQVRSWPRTPETDPYKFGLERLAEYLRKEVDPVPVWVAYNEFCAPSIPETLDALARDGVRHVQLITTMFTPGGSHSEVEIPDLLAEARQRHPDLTLEYVWPFDLELAARFLRDSLQGGTP